MTRQRKSANARRAGVTLVDLLVAMGVISLLISIGLPAVQQSRESARSVSCWNHLRQLGLAIHEFESSHQAYPLTRRNWAVEDELLPARSLHVELLPYLDFAAAYHQVDFSEFYPDKKYEPTAFVESNAKLLKVTVPVFQCPSDRGSLGGCNYRCSLGTAEATAISDGFFIDNVITRPADITDGLSNTIMMSERVLGSFSTKIDYWRDILKVDRMSETDDADGWTQACADAALTTQYSGAEAYSGGTWLRGGYRNTWYLHASPPNSSVPDCALAGPYGGGGPGLWSARSFHATNVNVVSGDGAVKAISENVSVQLWRALATRNGQEPLSEF